MIGDYRDSKTKEGITVERAADAKGRYTFTYYEGSSADSYWIKFTGTMFKLDNTTYIDFFQQTNSSLHNIPGGPPTGTQLLALIAGQTNHIVARLTFTDQGVGLSIPNHKGLEILAGRTSPSHCFFIHPEIMRLNLETSELRKLLKNAGDDVFPQATNFSKPKPLIK